MWRFTVLLATEPAPTGVGLDQDVAWSWHSETAGARLGTAVATGDCNGDGNDDVAVSAPELDGGTILLFLGGQTGLSSAPAWSVSGREGSALAFVDVDADGHDDIVVGSSGRSTNTYGGVELFRCSDTLPEFEPSWRLVATYNERGLGAVVANAGDMDGDGFGDLLVGCRGAADKNARDGPLWLFHGGSQGLPDTPTWELFPARIATFSASAADINHDGYSDIAVGRRGGVSLWHGGPVGPSAEAQVVYQSTGNGQEFGERMVLGADIDGDGHGELVVYHRQGGRGPEARRWGAVDVFPGTPNGPAVVAVKHTSDALRPAQALAYADVNGDGFDDLLLGVSEGRLGPRVLGVLGHPEQLLQVGWGAWQLRPPSGGPTRFGSALSTGDFNGDGLADLVVGAPSTRWGDAAELTEAGSVYAWHGKRAGGAGSDPDPEPDSGTPTDEGTTPAAPSGDAAAETTSATGCGCLTGLSGRGPALTAVALAVARRRRRAGGAAPTS